MRKRSFAIILALCLLLCGSSAFAAEGSVVTQSSGITGAVQQTVRLTQIKDQAAQLIYIPSEGDNLESSDVYQAVQSAWVWDGETLNRAAGVAAGPNGKETYYNLNMNGVVRIMRENGNNDPYWVRSDGVKMLGNYVMAAADLTIHPRGSIVPTTLGLAIVCDTGTFIEENPEQLDLAVNW